MRKERTATTQRLVTFGSASKAVAFTVLVSVKKTKSKQKLFAITAGETTKKSCSFHFRIIHHLDGFGKLRGKIALHRFVLFKMTGSQKVRKVL